MSDQQLPTWVKCEATYDNKTATPLEKFIYHHEPASADDPETWREGLIEVIATARADAIRECVDTVFALSVFRDSKNELPAIEFKSRCIATLESLTKKEGDDADR